MEALGKGGKPAVAHHENPILKTQPSLPDLQVVVRTYSTAPPGLRKTVNHGYKSIQQAHLINLAEIATALNRPVEHLLAFLAWHYPTPTTHTSNFDSGVGIFTLEGQFGAGLFLKRKLTSLIHDFWNRFVLCPLCESQTTDLIYSLATTENEIPPVSLKCLLCETTTNISPLNESPPKPITNFIHYISKHPPFDSKLFTHPKLQKALSKGTISRLTPLSAVQDLELFEILTAVPDFKIHLNEAIYCILNKKHCQIVRLLMLHQQVTQITNQFIIFTTHCFSLQLLPTELLNQIRIRLISLSHRDLLVEIENRGFQDELRYSPWERLNRLEKGEKLSLLTSDLKPGLKVDMFTEQGWLCGEIIQKKNGTLDIKIDQIQQGIRLKGDRETGLGESLRFCIGEGHYTKKL